MKHRVASLFSGCGGLDLGFELTGHFRVVWANDIFEPACRTFSKNFNLELSNEPEGAGTTFTGDVASADFLDVLGPEGADVVTGGPPCQDFSILRGAEKRKGIRVKRGRLYQHFLRALEAVQPKAFVFENVKGLASANGGSAVEQIARDFRNSAPGYDLPFFAIMDFSGVGVPQRRERLIIIGVRMDIAGRLVEVEGTLQTVASGVVAMLARDTRAFSSFPVTPMEVFAGKPLNRAEGSYRKCMLEYERSIHRANSPRAEEYMSSTWSVHSFEPWHDYIRLNNLENRAGLEAEKGALEKHKKLLAELGYFGRPLTGRYFEDGSNEILKELDAVKDRMKFIPPGENYKFVKGTKHEVGGLMSNIYRRIHPLKPSPTVIARGGGGTWGYHYLRNRQKLTNRERARLQTFPDSFLFEGKPSEVRRQIGEAVPPLAGKRIAEALSAVLRKI